MSTDEFFGDPAYFTHPAFRHEPVTSLVIPTRTFMEVIRDCYAKTSMTNTPSKDDITLWGFPVRLSPNMTTPIMVTRDGTRESVISFNAEHLTNPGILDQIRRESEKRLDFQARDDQDVKLLKKALAYDKIQRPKRGSKVRSLIIEIEED
jgi:hypothetical protein